MPLLRLLLLFALHVALTSGYIVTRIMLKNESRQEELKVLLNTQIGSFNYLKARAVHRRRRRGFFFLLACLFFSTSLCLVRAYPQILSK